MNIFKEFACAIAHVPSYSQFLKNKKGKVFGYSVYLVTLYFLISTIIPAAIFVSHVGNLTNFITDNIPDFKISDGKLWTSDAFIYDKNGIYFRADSKTPIDQEEIDKLSEDYSLIYILDEDAYYYQSGTNHNQVEWKDDKSFSFQKQDLYDMVPFFYGFSILFLILAYLFQFGFFYLGALMVALIAMSLNNSLKTNFSFGQLFILALYSRTLPLMLKCVVRLSGVPTSLFFFASIFMSLTYILLFMRSEINKRGLPQ